MVVVPSGAVADVTMVTLLVTVVGGMDVWGCGDKAANAHAGDAFGAGATHHTSFRHTPHSSRNGEPKKKHVTLPT